MNIGKYPLTGKRKQKTKSGFSSKEAAIEASNKLIYELFNDIYIEKSDQTFALFSIEWLTIYKEAYEVKPGTIRIRLYELNKLMPYFAELKLKEIQRKIYQDALNN
ncbi:Arm DNA-binding domain-containing protein [Solibacillus silvestris]|uniref:Arm DNA-binding domain-containing protein n=1 Tax=Solibacillus silvestris TaxID=76853 RepID=UPI003F7FF404